MDLKRIRKIVRLLCCGVFLSCPLGAAEKSPQADAASRKGAPLVRSYVVNKKVSDFPATRDLSTPEAAYATIMRDFMATGASGAEWSEISLRRLPGTARRPVAPEAVSNYLAAHIQEVVIYRDRLALVVAQMKEDNTAGFDQWFLFWRDGRWLNRGRDGLAPTLAAARESFAQKCESMYQAGMKEAGEKLPPRWHRPPVADPESHLKPYVEFLREHGREPHAFLMDALARHALVVMGEVHNRPAYWAFNRELVRDPGFAETVGTIYLELPSDHQPNIETFLAADTCRRDLVIEMLRDYQDWGWPCEPTLEFFVAVWEIDQKLPADKKLRIRLVDQAWPWEKIRTHADWQPYAVERDSFMAQNILKDRQTSHEKRHGFFIVGMQHAMEELYCFDRITPRHSAGWHLKQSLGDQLFTVFQHALVQSNEGQAQGRLALGLIDAAFAQLQDRPVAFTLREGPFGQLPFDGMPDANVYGAFRDGYDAYLYLIPLEDEIQSPLIPGFYSEPFAREVDRRWQLTYGRHLFSGTEAPTAERVTQARAVYWGQPRDWIRSLGPEKAWHYGEGWQTAVAREQERGVTREELVPELDKIRQGLKALDHREYPSPTAWERAFGFDYMTEAERDDMYRWWCDVLEEHPLESLEYGALSRNKQGLPQIQVTITLRGGGRFSRAFVFKYLPLPQRWQVRSGLDLHLDPQWKDLPKVKKGTA